MNEIVESFKVSLIEDGKSPTTILVVIYNNHNMERKFILDSYGEEVH